ncbi:MAG TPA: hypothetical protein VHT30_12485 [Acidimicrobiales bacterium]|jgi:hypothetical protein|nr:hypothetical protein [Acidimicrobiales bacterium]
MAQTDPPPPRSDRDWTTEAADRIEAVVTSVRDKTTVPVQKIAAIVVYGLVVAVAAPAALLLLLLGVLRLHVYLPYHPEGRRVWTTYVGLGAIFTALGAFMWRKRTARPKG